jgi:hypothetical protein
MMISFIFVKNLFIAIEAQLSKIASDYESFFVATIDVSSSLGRQLAIGKERG